jgi:IS30 family transposase
MLPQRTVLGTISGNRAFNHQLSLYQRGQILGISSSGQKCTNIQALLNVSRSTIQSTIKFEALRNNGDTQARSSRPKGYSEATKHRILRYVRLNPKDTYLQLISVCDLTIKKTTIKSILTQYSITNWRTRRRPFLTETNAAKRLA